MGKFHSVSKTLCTSSFYFANVYFCIVHFIIFVLGCCIQHFSAFSALYTVWPWRCSGCVLPWMCCKLKVGITSLGLNLKNVYSQLMMSNGTYVAFLWHKLVCVNWFVFLKPIRTKVTRCEFFFVLHVHDTVSVLYCLQPRSALKNSLETLKAW